MRAKLTKGERYKRTLEMIRLAEVEHLSLDEIGKKFGITKQAVSLNLKKIGYCVREQTKKHKKILENKYIFELLSKKIEMRDKIIANLKHQIIYRDKKIAELRRKNENKI